MKQDAEHNRLNRTESFPKPPGSDLGAVLSNAAWYAGITALFAATASKIPVINRIYNRGMLNEATEGAAIGGIIGAIVGYYDNQIRRREIYPLQVENHVLKDSLHQINEVVNGGPVNHAEKLLAERQQDEAQKIRS